MSQRTALLVTTALTVFVMVMLTGIAWQVLQKTSLGTLALQSTAPAQNEVNANVPQTNAPNAAEPAPQEQLAARETQYQQLIQQANARLDQAYKQQQEMSKQIADQKSAEQARAAAVAAANAQPKYKVTPQQAVAIALTTVPGAVLVKPAELVSFHETASFEVTLDQGVVYVDANTGAVLYNSAAIIVVRGGGGGGGGNAPAPAASNPPPAPHSGEKENHQEDHQPEHPEQEGHD
jgi:uncharacterized membrane protein YkoI